LCLATSSAVNVGRFAGSGAILPPLQPI
jgi:hypothetical protein